MASSHVPTTARQDTAEVRDQLLASLLSGRFRPGERAPSVRRMAALTGRSRRTVHRAYRELAEQGLLVIRWGSGTFFAEAHPLTVPATAPHPPAGLDTIPGRLSRFARLLGLDEAGFARLVAYWAGYGRENVSLGIVECNGEQRGLMASELSERLAVECREIPLRDLDAAGSRLAGVSAIVTSCCHREEVLPVAAHLGRPLFTVSMDAGFLPPLLDALERGPLVMVVRDGSYGPVLARFLETLRLPDDRLGRLQVVEPAGLVRVLAGTEDCGSLYVSPLVATALGPIHLEGWRKIAPRRFIAVDEIDRLWVHLAWMRASAGS